MITWQQLLLFAIVWILNHMHPQLPAIPVEMIDAAKAVTAASHKIGDLADAVMSWHLPAGVLAGVLVGVLVGMVLMNLFGGKRNV